VLTHRGKEQGTQNRVTITQEMVYEITVGEVMTSDVVTVNPDQLMSELRIIMRDNRISGTPVVEYGKLIGMISIEDLITALSDNNMATPIRTKMANNVQCLYEDEHLIDCIAKFSKYGYTRYPVLSREGELVGIITKGNIVEGLLKKLEIAYEQTEKKVDAAHHRPIGPRFFEDFSADEASIICKYHVVGQTLKDAGKVASDLKQVLKKLGIDQPLLRKIGVATYEAEINIASYTQGGEIQASVGKQGIIVEAVDNGPGIPDIELAMQPGYSTAPEWVRSLGFGAGMGLANIKKCADEMDLRSSVPEGTHLSMRFNYWH